MSNPVYRSLMCFRCGGRIEAVKFDDVMDRLIDGTWHRVPVFRVPAHRCFDCGNRWRGAYIDGTSDEVIDFWTQQYLTGIGRNKWYHKLRRRWRAYCNWYWNRSPWARWRHRCGLDRAS